MKKNIKLNILICIFNTLFLFGCSQKSNNIDFDFTTLKKPKKIELNNKDLNEINDDNNILIKDLIPLKDKQEILSKTKFGKKDPFSEGEIQSNKILEDLILTGFLNTENNKYAFVIYLDNEGTITEDSIGGVNTTLLPNGAKVINIDSKNMKLTISFDNEDFIFEN